MHGKDQDGSQLCAVTPVFGQPCEASTQTCDGPIADADVKTIVAYLRSLPAVDHDIPDSPCTTK